MRSFSTSLLFFLSSCQAAVVPPRARLVSRDVAVNSSYDFVIIGGGTSGLTVADRLTENPKVSVLVVEYGPLDQHEPSVLVPGLLNLTSSPYFYNLTSTPQAGLNNKTFMIPAAGVVGGGTVVNGMFFDRASVADYDAWTKLGAKGWGWNDLLPYFKKSENFTPPTKDFANEWDIETDSAFHGSGGPVQASFPVFSFPSIKNFLLGWKSLNVSTPKDPGDGHAYGAFWAASSLDPKDETRSYARTAHYDRVIGTRPNYHLLVNTTVQRILFEGNKTTGVEIVSKATNQTSVVNATKEVILAAGAPHSPQILQVSGIGDKALLDKLGVPVVVDLPGVGENFQDHPTVYMAFDFAKQLNPNSYLLTSDANYSATELDLYYSKRQGPYTITAESGNTVAFLPLPNMTANYLDIIKIAKSQPNSTARTELSKGLHKQRSIILDEYASIKASVQETGYGAGSVIPVTLVKPLSRGTIKAASLDIYDPPVINWGTFSDPTDLETMIAAVRINRALVASPPMQELQPTELSPGANVTTDEELRTALRSLVSPTYSHPCCTCSMMKKDYGGVVDEGLKVYGIEGLSIVDASVMPLIPATHLSATVYAVAEKAADIIKGRYGLS